jgi:hypothetical protein
MRYLKPHPIYEGKAELDELMNIINTTQEGADLKGLCELDPKRTGRIFVKPRGLAGSKTFIEKTETKDPNFTSVWHYTSLSNGVPFGGDRFTDAKYAIRDLWAYIISKNAPIGYSKDDFKRWLLDSQACGFHGKGADGRTIIDAYIQTKTPAGMITDADQYFATPDMQKKLAAAGLVRSSGNPSRFTLELDLTNIGKVLTELSTSLIGYHPITHRLTTIEAEIIIIPHAIKFAKSGDRSIRFKIGGLLKDLDKLEKKILTTWGKSIRAWIEQAIKYQMRPGISKEAEAFYMLEKAIIISLSEKIANLDSTSFSVIDDEMILRIADALKGDVALIASLPKDISGRVFKLLGYSDDDAEGIVDLKDVGLF